MNGKSVAEISVKFKGSAQVKWSVDETTRDSEGKDVRTTVDFVSDESYFENKYSLSGGKFVWIIA